MATLIGDLIAGILEFLFWIVWEVLPGLCYLTSVVLVSAATAGKVTVEFPKKSATSYPSRRTSPEGQTVLSPALGTIIGFSFWGTVIALAIIIHVYASARS